MQGGLIKKLDLREEIVSQLRDIAVDLKMEVIFMQGTKIKCNSLKPLVIYHVIRVRYTL